MPRTFQMLTADVMSLVLLESSFADLHVLLATCRLCRRVLTERIFWELYLERQLGERPTFPAVPIRALICTARDLPIIRAQATEIRSDVCATESGGEVSFAEKYSARWSDLQLFQNIVRIGYFEWLFRSMKHGQVLSRTVPAFFPLCGILQVFDCSDNRLTSLPSYLPPSLTQLVCRDNNLRALPELPPHLEVLDCAFNRLTWLPQLPYGLRQLLCNDNYLTELELPDSLSTVDFLDNPLASIPDPPSALARFFCIRCKYYICASDDHEHRGPVYCPVQHGPSSCRHPIGKNLFLAEWLARRKSL